MDRRGEKILKQQQEMAAENRCVAECFATPNGKECLALLRKLFYDRPSYQKGDAYHTAFREGQRDVVGYIRQAIGEHNKTEGVDNV